GRRGAGAAERGRAPAVNRLPLLPGGQAAMTRSRWLLIAAVASTAAAAPAAAQPLRPNILFIFDTSSSMNQINDMGQGTDGSPLCGNAGDGSDPTDANGPIR